MSRMGRPPKPTALKLVTGNPGKRAISKNEPKPPPATPSPPADLGAVGKAEWRRIVHRLADLGLMTDLDRGALTAYCDAFEDWTLARRAFAAIQERNKVTGGYMVRTTQGNVIQSPLVSVIRQARADMVRFATEFGMTPTARAGMDVSFGSSSSTDDGEKQAGHDFFGDSAT